CGSSCHRPRGKGGAAALAGSGGVGAGPCAGWPGLRADLGCHGGGRRRLLEACALRPRGEPPLRRVVRGCRGAPDRRRPPLRSHTGICCSGHDRRRRQCAGHSHRAGAPASGPLVGRRAAVRRRVVSARMTLADALGMTSDDVVALVGGGGKTTAMFRLAREMVARGGRAITTTTTRIFAAQIGLAPSHVRAVEATGERIAVELNAYGHTLVIGETSSETGKADGVSLDLFGRLRRWHPDACILNEADGSRMRPFKAPATHEPVIPEETTLVVMVVGADVFGRPLDAEH